MTEKYDFKKTSSLLDAEKEKGTKQLEISRLASWDHSSQSRHSGGIYAQESEKD